MKYLILQAVVLLRATGSISVREIPDSANTFPENKTDYRNQTMCGAKTVANYANVYDAKGESFQNDARLRFAGGLFLTIPIGKYPGVQPEAIYSPKDFMLRVEFLEGRGLRPYQNYHLSGYSPVLCLQPKSVSHCACRPTIFIPSQAERCV